MEEVTGMSVKVALSHIYDWMREMGSVDAKVLCGQALRHAAICHINHCKQRGCLDFRTIIGHMNDCNAECCFLYFVVHCMKCRLTQCPVRFCSALKYRKIYQDLLILERHYNEYVKESSSSFTSKLNLPPDAQMEISNIPEAGLMSPLVRSDINFECKTEPSSVIGDPVKKDMLKGIMRQLLILKRFAQKPEQHKYITERIVNILLQNFSLFPEYQAWISKTEVYLAMRRGVSIETSSQSTQKLASTGASRNKSDGEGKPGPSKISEKPEDSKSRSLKLLKPEIAEIVRKNSTAKPPEEFLKCIAECQSSTTAGSSHRESNTEKEKTPEVSQTQKIPSATKQMRLDIHSTPDDGLKYDCSIPDYHPVNNAFWKYGERVPFLALTRTLEVIESTSSRLKMATILSNYFRSVMILQKEDLLPSLYLCLCQLAPSYEGIELGIAEMTLLKAITTGAGRSAKSVKADVISTGDIGLVAEKSRLNQKAVFKPANLTIKTVYEKLKDIACMSGKSSMAVKTNKIVSLFVACRTTEAKFLFRLLSGKLRVGLAEQTILQALALACTKTPPNQDYPPQILDHSKKISADALKKKVEENALLIRTSFCECPNYTKIVSVLLEHGLEALPNHCQVTPGVPLKPMLAHPTKGIREIFDRFEGSKFTCEWKYDGERAQVHKTESGVISIFSRNQENTTMKYPDIVSIIQKSMAQNSIDSFILDCEAVAFDTESQKLLPFQILSTRKKKVSSGSEIKIKVCIFAFDLLYFNGRSMVTNSLENRRTLLREKFTFLSGEFQPATSKDTHIMEEVGAFLDEAIKGQCEGLMVKTLQEDASYEIAKRSRNWLKLKKDYLEGVGDTLDVVVIGGYLGQGKRTGVYGGFLLACYNEEEEEFQSLCKIGTGFSDEGLKNHAEFFKEHVIAAPKPYYRYEKSQPPDHWFNAAQVWEIKCADLTLSPVYYAARGLCDSNRGISLRFPRFIRIRTDKDIYDSTTSAQVADLYRSQSQVQNQPGASQSNQDEYY